MSGFVWSIPRVLHATQYTKYLLADVERSIVQPASIAVLSCALARLHVVLRVINDMADYRLEHADFIVDVRPPTVKLLIQVATMYWEAHGATIVAK